ncbi:MAG: branched-chain amino acid ABC transporter permease [Deltaproteobacteria bacterium]|nr:branched-chain amino acid ABC transporter permease [Deltaproteobacteria bacterium]
MRRYYPLILVSSIYLVLFLIGMDVKGMWQPMALLVFYAALGQAFNIFLGMTGYVDFGYVAFLAMGSYGMAITISNLHDIQWLGWGIVPIGLIAGLVMSALLSTAVGAIALRLRGAYFAIATIGVNEGFRYLIEGARIWGGAEGIIISKALRTAFGADGANYISTFWADAFVYIIAVSTAFVTFFYLNSRIGYALLALREDEDAARVMGINTTRYKIIAFITSASFGGLIGASAWALKLTYVFPADVFEITYAVEAIVIVLLGGTGTLLGPVIGGIIYASLKYWLSVIFPGLQLFILAPIIIVIIVVFPQGFIGLLKTRLKGTRMEGVIV